MAGRRAGGCFPCLFQGEVSCEADEVPYSNNTTSNNQAQPSVKPCGFPNHEKQSPRSASSTVVDAGMRVERPLSRASSSLLPLHVARLSFDIDKKLTLIDEKSHAVLKYRTPHFRATACVQIPGLEEGDDIQVGWIQTCLHMLFVNTYGSYGMTSWEFPEIVSGCYKMVSDADGKQYPWYGARSEVVRLTGPCPQQNIEVEMNDNFFPQVTWYIPEESFDRVPRLTHIHRKQKFYTFLAVKNLRDGRIHTLRTITWRMELNVEVDPNAPLGQRAKLRDPQHQMPPELVKEPVELPDYALRPPNANNSQTLVWRPLGGRPSIIVPPLHSTVPMDEYINSTEDLTPTRIMQRES